MDLHLNPARAYFVADQTEELGLAGRQFPGQAVAVKDRQPCLDESLLFLVEVDQGRIRVLGLMDQLLLKPPERDEEGAVVLDRRLIGQDELQTGQGYVALCAIRVFFISG